MKKSVSLCMGTSIILMFLTEDGKEHSVSVTPPRRDQG